MHISPATHYFTFPNLEGELSRYNIVKERFKITKRLLCRIPKSTWDLRSVYWTLIFIVFNQYWHVYCLSIVCFQNKYGIVRLKD